MRDLVTSPNMDRLIAGCVRNRRLVAIVLASVFLFGCNRRAGLNFDCTWVVDPALRVDLSDESHVQHLLDDIRVAEELAMRYGDWMAGWRLVETFGIVSRHGGLKNRELGRQSRQQCVATLFQAIASTHKVAVSDIERIRPRLADRGFDWPVTIPVAVLLVFAVARFMRWIRNRFEADEWAAWIVATLFASVIVPAAVVALGIAWAAVVEIVRLGNEHVAGRARMDGLRANVVVVLGIGIAAVWVASGITAMRKRSAMVRERTASG
jgi:hypothetical protein